MWLFSLAAKQLIWTSSVTLTFRATILKIFLFSSIFEGRKKDKIKEWRDTTTSLAGEERERENHNQVRLGLQSASWGKT
jgi:hypothetical protein